MNRAEFNQHLAAHGVKTRPEGLRLASFPMELRTALYDILVAWDSTKNEHVKEALMRDVKNRLLDHFRCTLGSEVAQFSKQVTYIRGVIVWSVERLFFGSDNVELFTIEVDLFSGETFIFPGSV